MSGLPWGIDGPEGPLGLLLDVALRGGVLLVAAALVAFLFRGSSAAVRHLVWGTALGAMLLLPAVSVLAPNWTVTVPFLEAREAAPATMHSEPALDHFAVDAGDRELLPILEGATVVKTPRSTAAHSHHHEHAESEQSAALPRRDLVSTRGPVTAAGSDRPLSWWILSTWLAGMGLVLVLLLAARLRVSWIAHRAEHVTEGALVDTLHETADRLELARAPRLLLGGEREIPMTWGLWRPVILLPRTARTWGGDRTRAVLLHEMAHVRRGDVVTRLLAEVACAVYWFHPVVWFAARRLHQESEHAADDAALAAGYRASTYAEELLELARGLTGAYRGYSMVTMARPSQLEGRLMAVLDAGRRRHGVSRRVSIPAACVAGTLAVAAAALTPTAPVAEVAGERDGFRVAAPSPPAPPAPPAFPAPPAPPTPPASPAVAMSGGPDATALAHQQYLAMKQDIRRGDTRSDDREISDEFEGRWRVDFGQRNVRVELESTGRGWGRWQSSFSLPAEDIRDLVTPGEDVEFELRRDAGSLVFFGELEGTRPGDRGRGYFTFAPDRGFADDLVDLGYERADDSELFELTLHDMDREFVEGLAEAGYRLGDLDELVEFRIHGVTPDYVDAMQRAGFTKLDSDELVEFRIHGVDPGYVAELEAHGFDHLDSDEIVEMKIHGVSVDYMRAMADAGIDVGHMDADEITELRIHGVTPEFVREYEALGFRDLPGDELVELRIHGVTPDYIGGMRSVGLDIDDIDELVEMKIHGVTPEFVRRMRELEVRGLRDPETFSELRIHGVTPEFVERLQEEGITDVDADELVEMKIHGFDRFLDRRDRGSRDRN